MRRSIRIRFARLLEGLAGRIVLLSLRLRHDVPADEWYRISDRLMEHYRQDAARRRE